MQVHRTLLHRTHHQFHLLLQVTRTHHIRRLATHHTQAIRRIHLILHTRAIQHTRIAREILITHTQLIQESHVNQDTHVIQILRVQETRESHVNRLQNHRDHHVYQDSIEDHNNNVEFKTQRGDLK